MDLACRWALKSKDPSTRVGAVIAKDKDFISGGFNGFAKGVKDTVERLGDRDLKYPLTIHAEVNAILFAKCDLKGTTLYCTHPPCERCAPLICQADISKVVYLEPTEEFKKRWDCSLSFEQFLEKGVLVLEMPRSRLS